MFQVRDIFGSRAGIHCALCAVHQARDGGPNFCGKLAEVHQFGYLGQRARNREWIV